MNNIKNFVWSTIGATIYGFTSLFFLIIITRINGLNDAGMFTYSFAIACIFGAIGSYSGKTFQVTETNNDLSDSDYLYHKLTTCFIMNLLSIIFCLITKTDNTKTILIIILTVFRSIDVFIDSIHAIIQRNGKLYQVGQSMFIRTICLVVLFILMDSITKNVIITCFSILIFNIIYCIFVDFAKIKGNFKITKYDFNKNKMLIKLGLTVCLYSFLSIYILNASKYAINKFQTDEIQAIFGIIIMPASFLALFSQYLVQPFLNSITDKTKNNQKKELMKSWFNISLCIIGIGIVCIIICYFIGIPILELVYGVSLDNQLNNLLIILLGSIFHSLVILISSIFIAYRETVKQLILLIITAIVAIFVCNRLTEYYGITGASYSYCIITCVEFILHFIALMLKLKNDKKITIRLMGGVGNQMFQYATLRVMMLKENQKGIISLKGITNKTHNVYSLNHFNIKKEIEVINKESIKSKLTYYLLYGFYCIFLIKLKYGFSIINKIQPILNYLGVYFVPDGYVKLNNSKNSNNVMVGYFQSLKYFDEYKDIIKKELKVIEPVLENNKNILKEIKTENSVCVHIRRGDYIGTKHQVCDESYYLKSIEIMKNKVKKPKFYVFSDDIKWVKNNIKFKDKVTFIEGNNPNYEELRLMYSCKHFIISNSSFSWWAQYLTDNKNRVTIAPKKWFLNSNQKIDIYEDDWILIDGVND